MQGLNHFFFREKQIMWILFSLCSVATYGEKIEPKQVNIDKNSFGLSSCKLFVKALRGSAY